MQAWPLSWCREGWGLAPEAESEAGVGLAEQGVGAGVTPRAAPVPVLQCATAPSRCPISARQPCSHLTQSPLRVLEVAPRRCRHREPQARWKSLWMGWGSRVQTMGQPTTLMSGSALVLESLLLCLWKLYLCLSPGALSGCGCRSREDDRG